MPIWRRFGVAAKENEISEKESWLPWQRPLKILKSRFRSFMYSHSGTEWTQLNAKKTQRNALYYVTLHCITLFKKRKPTIEATCTCSYCTLSPSAEYRWNSIVRIKLTNRLICECHSVVFLHLRIFYGNCKCFSSLSVQSTQFCSLLFSCNVTVLINKIFIHSFMQRTSRDQKINFQTDHLGLQGGPAKKVRSQTHGHNSVKS